MINLYERLNILPTATEKEIQAAMKKAAQEQRMELEELKKCQQWLLNPEVRVKYNARLFAEHPEILAQLMQPKPEEPKEPTEPQKPKKSQSKTEKPAYKIKGVHRETANNQGDLQPENLRQDNFGQSILIIIICVVGFLMFSCVAKKGDGDKPSAAETAVLCSREIKPKLSYPSSYEYVYDNRQKMTRQNDGTYALEFYYTAQNAFGVPSRFVAMCWTDGKTTLLLGTEEDK